MKTVLLSGISCEPLINVVSIPATNAVVVMGLVATLPALVLWEAAFCCIKDHIMLYKGNEIRCF